MTGTRPPSNARIAVVVLIGFAAFWYLSGTWAWGAFFGIAMLGTGVFLRAREREIQQHPAPPSEAAFALNKQVPGMLVHEAGDEVDDQGRRASFMKDIERRRRQDEYRERRRREKVDASNAEARRMRDERTAEAERGLQETHAKIRRPAFGFLVCDECAGDDTLEPPSFLRDR